MEDKKTSLEGTHNACRINLSLVAESRSQAPESRAGSLTLESVDCFYGFALAHTTPHSWNDKMARIKTIRNNLPPAAHRCMPIFSQMFNAHFL